jgi:hypothetical protein
MLPFGPAVAVTVGAAVVMVNVCVRTVSAFPALSVEKNLRSVEFNIEKGTRNMVAGVQPVPRQ